MRSLGAGIVEANVFAYGMVAGARRATCGLMGQLTRGRDSSIFGRLFHVLDDQHVDGFFSRFQLEPELPL